MPTDKKPKFVRKGPMKYKTILPAPSDGVESLVHISSDLMKRIFNLDECDYFITDESRLKDFTDFGSGDIKPLLSKIKRIYGVDVSDVPNGNLLEIFRRVGTRIPRPAGRAHNASRQIAMKAINKQTKH